MVISNRVIVLIALIIMIGFVFSDGIYRFDKIQAGVVHKYNKITGTVQICIQDRGCVDF